MVALRNLLPPDPNDRATARSLLNSQPKLADFVLQFYRFVDANYEDLEISLDTQQFEEWDPPLTIMVQGPLERSQYMGLYYELLDAANALSGYDRNLVHISLRPTEAFKTDPA